MTTPTIIADCGGVEIIKGACKVLSQTGVACTGPESADHVHPEEAIASCLYNECWVCVCGNTIDASGFYPCDPITGAEAEPTTGPWDGKSYRCSDCGRVIDASSNAQQASGVWTVKVAAHPATPIEVTV